MEIIDLLIFFLNKNPKDISPNLFDFNIVNLYIYYKEKCKKIYTSLKIDKFDISDLEYDLNNDIINVDYTENSLFRLNINYHFLKIYEVYKEIIKSICDDKKIKLRTLNYFDFNILKIMENMGLYLSKDIFIRNYLKFFKNIENDSLLNYLFILLSSNDFRDECLNFLKNNDNELYLKLYEKLDKTIIENKYDFIYFFKNVEINKLKKNIVNINNPNCSIFTDLYLNIIDESIPSTFNNNIKNDIRNFVNYFNNNDVENYDYLLEKINDYIKSENENSKNLINVCYNIWLELINQNLPQINSFEIENINVDNIFTLLIQLSQFKPNDLIELTNNEDSKLIFSTILFSFYIYANSIFDVVQKDYDSIYEYAISKYPKYRIDELMIKNFDDININVIEYIPNNNFRRMPDLNGIKEQYILCNRLNQLKKKDKYSIFFTNYFYNFYIKGKEIEIDLISNHIQVFLFNRGRVGELNLIKIYNINYLSIPFFEENKNIYKYINNLEINLLKMNKILNGYKRSSIDYYFLLNQVFFGDQFGIISKNKETILNNIYLRLIEKKTQFFEL